MKHIRSRLINEYLIIPLLILWAIWICVKYHQYHPFLYQRIKPLFEPVLLTSLSLIFIFISFGVGYRIFRLFKVNTSLLEIFLFSCGIGFGILMYLTFFIGAIAMLYHSVIYSLLAILGLFSIKEVIIFYQLFKKKGFMSKSKKSNSFFEQGIKVIIIFLLALCFINALTPYVSWDAAVAHLTLPKRYLQMHKIGFVPYSFSSNIPLNMQMLYTLALAVKGPVLGKLLHFTFGLLTLLIIKSFSNRYFSPQIGLLAMAIFLTNPVVVFEISSAYVDLGVSFYLLLALYGFFLWVDSNNKIWLYIMAIFSGISLGIKYTSAFGIIILTLGILIKLFKDRIKIYRIIKDICLFFIIVSLFFIPWAIKNYVLVGNPVYPMLSSIFGGVDKEFIKAYDEFVHRSCMGRRFIDYLLLPWNLTIKANYGHEFFDNFINPLGLIFIPFLIFLKKIDIKVIYLLGYCLLFIFIWSFFAQQMRFLLPILPIIGIISAYSIHTLILEGKLIKKIHKIILICILAILSFMSLPHILGLGEDFGLSNNLSVVCGMESKEAFLLRTFPPYDTFKYINNNLPQDAKILFLWENRGFYCEREYIFDSVFEASWILKMVKDSKDGLGLFKKLKQLKVTHILLNKRLAAIFYDPKRTEIKIIEDFLGNYTQLVYSKNDVDLYILKK